MPDQKKETARGIPRQDFFAAHALMGLLSSGDFALNLEPNPDSRAIERQVKDIASRAASIGEEMAFVTQALDRGAAVLANRKKPRSPGND